MQFSNTKNVIKYIIFGGITCAILKTVPTKQLSLVEIASLVCVILIGIYSLECLTATPSVTENMDSIKENMSNSDSKKMFDLDMDVDLDFNTTTNKQKETHDTTGTKKSNDLLNDMLKDEKNEMNEINEKNEKNKTNEKLDSRQPPKNPEGLDLDEIQDELRKRNLSNLLDDEEMNDELNDEIKPKPGSKSELDLLKEMESKDSNNLPDDYSILDEQLTNKLNIDDSEVVNCDVEVAKMRQELQDTITKLRQELLSKDSKVEKSPFAKKYMSILIADLLEKKILEKADVENINAKLISGATTSEEVIISLERLRSIGKPKNVSEAKDTQNDMKYSDLPSDYYNPLGDKIANQWDNEFTILNTDKWQIPQPRPPVCISSGPCKVCPDTTPGYTNLKEWDDSRVVTNNKVNKKWALDQANSS